MHYVYKAIKKDVLDYCIRNVSGTRALWSWFMLFAPVKSKKVFKNQPPLLFPSHKRHTYTRTRYATGADAAVFRVHCCTVLRATQTRCVEPCRWRCIRKRFRGVLVLQKLVDGPLMAKWKKPGYERLCSTYVINSKNYKFGTVSICRVSSRSVCSLLVCPLLLLLSRSPDPRVCVCARARIVPRARLRSSCIARKHALAHNRTYYCM